MAKTTVELPDDLVLAAKKRALDEGTTLRHVLERSLRKELAEAAGKSKSVQIEWIVAEGGLAPGLDPANRKEMRRYLDK